MKRILPTVLALSAILLCACRVVPIQSPETEPNTTPALQTLPETVPQTQPETQPQTAFETASETQPQTLPVTEPPVEKIAVPLGFYVKNKEKGVRERITELTSEWNAGSDIRVFSSFLSEEQTISNKKYAGVWRDCIAKWEGAVPVKLGYRLTYTLKESGQTVCVTVLRPEDTKTCFNDLEIYLYDDVAHENDSWYSHILPEEYGENTVMTSIKVTAGKTVDRIGDCITLTVFAYTDAETANPQTEYTVTMNRKKA